MSLLDSELARIKYELGYNVLTIGALPYVDYHSLFDLVIQPYVSAGAKTTSNTETDAVTSPTLSSLTLASATGFHASDIVIVDVDSVQERCTVESVSGSRINVLLSKAHTGTFPVTVEGGETIIRDILRKLYDVADKIEASAKTAGLKSAGRGAVEWYGGTASASILSALTDVRSYWRTELASALGVPSLWAMRRGGGSSELY